LGPAAPREVRVRRDGRSVATVALRERESVVLDLPPGRYDIEDPEGHALGPIEVRAGERTLAMRERPLVEDADVSGPPSAATSSPRPPRVRASGDRPDWRRVGAPLLSTFVPGLGQAVNHRPGKAAGYFVGTVALALGTAAVALSDDPFEGATRGDGGVGGGAEIGRLIALSGLSSALLLVYAAQIMDARKDAVGGETRSHTRHRVAIGLNRFSTVGFAPGQPSYALYDDWSLSLLGQIVPRVSLGVSDLSLALASDLRQVTVQGGVRSTYRFVQRPRVWLAGGGGVLLQGTSARPPSGPLDPDAERPDLERRFGSAVYLQLETKVFILDRWSLDLMPRVSVPLTHRDYGRGHKIPRWATTFELGVGLGVYL